MNNPMSEYRLREEGKPLGVHPPTRCCNYEGLSTMPHPVCWNPYNKVVQCHNCGHVYSPIQRGRELAACQIIRQCWYTLRSALNRFDTIRETNPEIYLESDMAAINKVLPHTSAVYTLEDAENAIKGVTQ